MEPTTIQAIAETIQETTLAYDANDLLKITDTSFFGKLGFSLQVTLIGLSIVFSILIIIYIFLLIFGRVMNNLSGKKETVVQEIKNPVVEIQTEPETIKTDDDGELIAVIAAAISMQTGKPISGFRVVSFKKRVNWN